MNRLTAVARRYAKAIAALCLAVGTWGTTAFQDDAINTGEWWGLGVAVLTAAGVWAIPNRPPVGEPADPTISEQG
jgi:hypothetical protein